MKDSKILSELLMESIEDQETNFDFKLILIHLFRHWWLFVISVILFVSLAIAYIFFSTPEYGASASILIKSDNEVGFIQNMILSDLEGLNYSKKVENEVEVIGSYSLMRDAIEELPLHASYYVEDEYSRRKEIYGSEVPVIFTFVQPNYFISKLPDDRTIRIHLKDESITLDFDENSSTDYDYGDTISNWYGKFYFEKALEFDNFTPREIIVYLDNKDQLAARYSNKLKLTLSNKYASVIIMSLTDPVPRKGVDILNKLVEVYNQQAVKEKNVTADNTIGFIDKQLNSLTSELTSVERQIEEYKRTRSVSDLNSEYAAVVQNSTMYESQLSRNRIQMEVLESIQKYIDRPIGNQVEVPSSLSIEDATLSDLIMRFNQMKREIERISRTVQQNSPILKTLVDELQSLKYSIQSNLTNIKSGLLIENRNLAEKIAEIDSRISKVPEIERGLLELTRLQESKQEQVLYLQGKMEEAELSLASNTVANARVIDYASASGTPVKPKKPVILGLSFLMGLGLPLAFVYYKYNLSGKVVKKGDVERLIKIPILGEISKSDSKDFLVIAKGSRTPIGEQFRLVRSNLTFLQKSENCKVILVTSSISGEGKTFFGYNLASTLRLSGKRVVLLEFDLRKPALFKNLKLKGDKGIVDYILDKSTTVQDLLIESECVDGLKLIACGAIPNEPNELMSNSRVEELITTLEKDFDHIIIDSAPIGTVSDALNLSHFVDLCLFMVRFNYSEKKNLEFAQKLNLEQRFRKVRLILNDVTASNGYYGYTYGYGYGDKEAKKQMTV